MGRPVITVKDEEDEAVSLYCIVPIDRKIRDWKNVTYTIEWFSEGKLVKEDLFCDLPQKKNCIPLPNDKEIRSLLRGDDGLYEPGQWVMKCIFAKF